VVDEDARPGRAPGGRRRRRRHRGVAAGAAVAGAAVQFSRGALRVHRCSVGDGLGAVGHQRNHGRAAGGRGARAGQATHRLPHTGQGERRAGHRQGSLGAAAGSRADRPMARSGYENAGAPTDAGLFAALRAVWSCDHHLQHCLCRLRAAGTGRPCRCPRHRPPTYDRARTGTTPTALRCPTALPARAAAEPSTGGRTRMGRQTQVVPWT